MNVSSKRASVSGAIPPRAPAARPSNHWRTPKLARRHYLLALSLLAATSTLALPAFSTLAAEPTIALVQINQQALFFTQMNEGAEKKAQELGAKLVIFNANNDPAAQERRVGLPVVSFDLVDQYRTDNLNRPSDHPPWADSHDPVWAAARCRNASLTASS